MLVSFRCLAVSLPVVVAYTYDAFLSKFSIAIRASELLLW